MDGDKEMNLRYAGRCAQCGGDIPRGARAIYNTTARNVRHLDCVGGIDLGIPGGSAQREYERRLATDNARITEQKERVQAVFGTGFLGRVATRLAVDDRPRQSTRSWGQGASGEERVALVLDGLADVGVITLHDRRIPGTRSNIDHVAVTPWGVWVIDAKRYVDKRPSLVIEGGFFGLGGTSRLLVGGRRKDNLVDGVHRQMACARDVVGDAAPVRGALAFVDAEWPLLGGDFSVRGVAVLWPKRLVTVMLQRSAPTVDVGEVARLLAAHFPPA